MRFHINLASQPYQDAGRFYRRWLMGVGGLTLVTAALVYLAASGWRASFEGDRQLRQEKQTLAKLERYEQEDNAILEKAENRDVRQHSEFFNDLIRRKAFSWTQVFSDLERLMPPRLHVVSIKPELSEANQLTIHMLVAGDSRARALELVKRMESSKSFLAPAVDSETQGQPPDTIKVEISALYTPRPPTPSTQVQARARPPQGVK